MKDRAYEIARNPKYVVYQRTLASMVYKFFAKGTRSQAKLNVNEELAKKLHKSVIKMNRDNKSAS